MSLFWRSSFSSSSRRGREQRRTITFTIVAGGKELSRVVDSWDQIVNLKNLIKPFAVYNPGKRSWRLRYITMVEEEKAVETLATILDLSRDEARELIKKNNELIRRDAEKIVKENPTAIVSLTGYLEDLEYRLLTRYARKVSPRVFVVDEQSLERSLRLLGDEGIDRLLEDFRKWLDDIAPLPVVYSREGLLKAFNEFLSSLKRGVAEYVHYKGSKGGRGWIRIRGLAGKYVAKIFGDARERLRIPYNITTFVDGRKELKSVGIDVYRKKRDGVEVAPFLYAILKHEKGIEPKEVNFRTPRLEPVLDYIDPGRVLARLRKYQREALERWEKNGYRGVIAIPTGGGKTWIGLAAIAKLRLPTVIFVPTIELAIQWRDKFLIPILGVRPSDVGILGGGHSELGKPILISTYQSGEKHAFEIGQFYGLYIYDEGHHVAAETFKRIAWYQMTPYDMVLTATVERDDGNEEMIYSMLGEKIYAISYNELEAMGYVAPVSIRVRGVPFPPDEEKQYMEYVVAEARARKELSKLYRAARKALGNPDNLREAILNNPLYAKTYKKLNRALMSARQKRRVLEQSNSNKTREAARLASELYREGHKVFVFTNLVKQAEEIQRLLEKRYGIYGGVALVTGGMSSKEREKVFKDFREGRLQLIVTTTVLDEGVDVPDATAAVIVSSRALKHPRQYVQRIGRIVRPKGDTLSKIYILYTKAPRLERYWEVLDPVVLADIRDTLYSIASGLEETSKNSLLNALTEFYGSSVEEE